MGACGSTPDIRFDPSIFEDQSIPHPDIPACRMSKIPFDQEQNAQYTIYDIVTTSKEKFGGKACLGWRSSPTATFDVWFTYAQVFEKSTNVGCGLRQLKQQPNNETFIGVYSKNRHEVLLTQIGCYQHSMVVVPMYDTLGTEAIEHIVNQTKMQVIVCDDEGKVKSLLRFGREKFPAVTTVVCMDPVNEETTSAVQQQGWALMSFNDLELQGEENPVDQVVCKPDSLMLVCYTSGTTGVPKGVMISHNAMYSNVCSLILTAEQFEGASFMEDEAHLSFLPLAHVFEQMNVFSMMKVGGKIGFFSGDPKRLTEDIRHLRPTIFVGVPKIFNRMYDRVMALVNSSALKKKMMTAGLNSKEKLFRKGIVTRSTFWDKMVFKRLQEAMGGRVRLILTGSAPISPPVLRFFRLAFGALVAEGYGQTETGGAISGTLLGEYKTGEVGPPFPCSVVKLVDVPEMNYMTANNAGEVCTKGCNLFKGYLHDEEKTNEALDSDGWLHTGDIGMWTERGTLKIVDRKKNIFKLSQGEYVAPEKIEQIYSNCSLIAQCLVYGNSLMSYLVAIVVPDEEVLPDFAKRKLNLNSSDMAVLCKDEGVKAAIMEEMKIMGKESKLFGFEQVKDIHLVDEQFSVENGLLTSTFKVRRLQCIAKYQDVLNSMYESEAR